MLRILALVLALAVTVVVDSMVDRHCILASEEAKDRGLESYEKPLVLHNCHQFENKSLVVVVVGALAMLYGRIAQLKPIKFLWALALALAVAAGGLSLLFELIGYGAEGQYEVILPFWYSSLPLIALDGFALALTILVLAIGPPRGWSGDQELGWL